MGPKNILKNKYTPRRNLKEEVFVHVIRESFPTVESFQE